MQNYQSFLDLLQLSSPTLPLGAYSYSEGLEYLINLNQINNQEELYLWLQHELNYGAIRLESAVMIRGYRHFNNLEQLNYWNNWLTASKETKELRQQSQQMGKSLVNLLTKLTDNPIFLKIKTNLTYPCNYPLGFGIAVAYWKINLGMALQAYLHNWASNLINAGVKLIPLGQTAGQILLNQINSVILSEYNQILNLQDHELYTCTLGLSLASMNHEHQYSRLFRS